MAKIKKRADFEICGRLIPAGTRLAFDVPVPDLYVHAELSIPIQVIHGKRDGPVLFVSGAVHGDEIMGVEIVRRLLGSKRLRNIRGTLVAVPVVNIFGFLNQSRYLPDRRDLNRSFPGTEKGSIAARLANVFITEIVSRCTHGIDLHTAAVNRENLPQVRAETDDPDVEAMARAFGLPVIVNSSVIDGSLRSAAGDLGVKVLVYEAGEALRFDETAIRGGVNGVIRVMDHLEMLVRRKAGEPKRRGRVSTLTRSSRWIRAPQSGIHRAICRLGTQVSKGDILGYIANPLGENEVPVESSVDGIIIGRSNIPLVTEGEALFHVATFVTSDEAVAERIDKVEEVLDRALSGSGYEEPPIV